MSYVYYTKFHDGQKVVPKLKPDGAVGVVTEIRILNQTTCEYLVAWNNGVKAWCTIHEIIAYKRENGITSN